MATTIDSDLAQEVAEALEDTGVRLTVDQVHVLLDGHAELIELLDDWGVDDTDCLGQLINLLSDQLVGEPWPTYGSVNQGRDLDAFTERLHAAARKHGYQVVDEDGEVVPASPSGQGLPDPTRPN